MVMGHLLTGVTMAQTGPSLAGCPILPADNVWNTPIDGLPIDPNSAAYIATIGVDRGVHPDFGSGLWEGAPIGIPYNIVPGTQPKVKITFDYDDESDPGPYPLPPGAEIEGGYNSDGDRHILVLDKDDCMLYETWSTYPQPDGSWQAGSGAIFDLQSNALRPSGWTSADAAGLPILPGLVRYDEVASGEIRHAIRVTVPKTREEFIWPARHYASNLTGLNYPPMGQRFRLKADFDISGFSPTVQVILRALKRYGMILADNGSAWFISGVPDSRWNNDVLVGELAQVTGSDFEAVDESSLMIDPDSGQARQEGPGVLSVTPADGFSSSGNSGGPFSPSSKPYTLQNTGGSSINWTASNGQTWVSLSSTSGTLGPGASTTVTVSINSSANSLTPGSYSDTASFTNTTNGNGNTTRSVSLTVNTSGPVISPDEGTIGTEFTITGSGFGTTKGKVLIGNVAPKILEWTDSSIRCQLVKSPHLGTYDVTIQPKGASPIVIESGFTIAVPEIDSVEPSSGTANEQITVIGFYFGTKKGKVLLEGKNCKVASWMMAPSTGESEIQFIVPKGISSGVHEMEVINGVGSGTVNFTVE